MAGIEKDHWLGVPGPMTQNQLWKVFLDLFDSRLRVDFHGLPPKLLNLLPLVRLRTIRILDATA
jgi:hypothetical protein